MSLASYIAFPLCEMSSTS